MGVVCIRYKLRRHVISDLCQEHMSKDRVALSLFSSCAPVYINLHGGRSHIAHTQYTGCMLHNGIIASYMTDKRQITDLGFMCCLNSDSSNNLEKFQLVNSISSKGDKGCLPQCDIMQDM